MRFRYWLSVLETAYSPSDVRGIAAYEGNVAYAIIGRSESCAMNSEAMLKTAGHSRRKGLLHFVLLHCDGGVD